MTETLVHEDENQIIIQTISQINKSYNIGLTIKFKDVHVLFSYIHNYIKASTLTAIAIC